MQSQRAGLRVHAIVTVVALILGVSASHAPVATQQRLPRFERGDCLIPAGEWAREARVDCGHLVVPELRERPTGRTVRLAVAILRAQEPSGAPPLVFLHGGPGGNGLRSRFPRQAAAWPLARRRDIIIYDQRGSGLSEPRLCPEIADTPSGLGGADFARACVTALKAAGIEPTAYSTVANATDAIDLRRTLGYRTWDIYGVSYGGRLAQELMRRDAAGIRAVVLANSPPLGPQTFAESPLSFQRVFERVFASCARQPSCATAFPSLEQDFYSVYDDLDAMPFEFQTTPSTTVRVDGARFASAVRAQLGATGFTRIPLLIHEFRRGDRERAARVLFSQGSGNPLISGVTTQLVNSNDVCGRTLSDTAASINSIVRPPFRAASPQGLNCAIWQDRFADPSTYAPVQNDIPTLILTGEFDDRAPTEHGRQIASRLKRAFHYDFPGETHGQLSPGCHESIIWQFLENPTRQPDAACIATMTGVTFETSNLDLQILVFRITDADRTSTFTGSWQAIVAGPPETTTIELRLNGSSVTGTVAQPRRTVPVFAGRVERGALTFRAVSPDGDRTITISGTVNGDELDLSRDFELRTGGNPGTYGIFGIDGPRTFTARRVEP